MDRCSGNVYISKRAAGEIRELDRGTGENRRLVDGLAQPGQLLALYRTGFTCPSSFQLLVIEEGRDQVTLVFPEDRRVTEWM